MINDELLQVKDACLYFKVARSTLYRYMDEKKIDYLNKNGKRYIKNSDLKEFFIEKQGSPNSSQSVSFDHGYVNEISDRINKLCSLIESQNVLIKGMKMEIDSLNKRLSDTARTKVPKPKDKVTGDNKRRSLESRRKVFDILKKYGHSKLPQQKDMAAEAGVDRNTFSKYYKEWKLSKVDLDESH